MHTQKQIADEPAALLDILDVANRLDCSRNHVANLDARGALPRPIRIGRLKKWSPSEIDSWIAAGAPDRETWERDRAARTGVESGAR
jgi:predicted DNA-binding transcriptional regulator AlpA